MISLSFFSLPTPYQNQDLDKEDKIQKSIAYYELQLAEVWENLAKAVGDSYRVEFPPSHEQNMILLSKHMAAYRREMQIMEYIDELKSKLSTSLRKCKRD